MAISIRNLICVFAFATFLFSCKKNTVSQPSNPVNGCSLTESLIDYTQIINLTDSTAPDTSYSYFHYSSANLITSITDKTGNTTQSRSYPDNLTMNVVNGYSTPILCGGNFYNAQGQIVLATQYNIQNANDTQTKTVFHYSYNSNGKMASVIDSTLDKSGNLPGVYSDTTTYTWVGGNIATQDFLNSGRHFISRFEYYSSIPSNIFFDKFPYWTNPQNVNMALLNANFLKKQANCDANGHVNDSTTYQPTFDANNRLTTMLVMGYYNMGSFWQIYKWVYIYHYKCKQ